MRTRSVILSDGGDKTGGGGGLEEEQASVQWYHHCPGVSPPLRETGDTRVH